MFDENQLIINKQTKNMMLPLFALMVLVSSKTEADTLLHMLNCHRNGCLSVTTKNYIIYCFGKFSRQGGVGFNVHNKKNHLVKGIRGIPNSDFAAQNQSKFARRFTLDYAMLLHPNIFDGRFQF